MLDYHLHLWPHSVADVEPTLEQVRDYCGRAVAVGVTEVALTEHLFRFTQADDLLGGFWSDEPDSALAESMAAYWHHHARVDLDAYVECVLAAKAEGLPVVLGLEVDYYRDRMDEVAGLLAGYPFDVLLGSVHWIGTWRFDDIDDAVSMDQWDTRSVDAAFDDYARALEELAASATCDVLAHPDLVKVTGRRPDAGVLRAWWDRLAEAAASSGMAAECSSAGWRKPVGEAYPAPGLLERLVARGVPLTTASDAHRALDVADHGDDLRALLAGAGATGLRAFHARLPVDVPIAAPATPTVAHEGAGR